MATLTAVGRTGSTLAIVNLDRFAAINTDLGHRAGDQLLVLLGGRLQAAAARRGAAVYLLGRDEFAVLWPGARDSLMDDVAALLRRLSRPAELHLLGRTVTVEVSACAGLCTPGELVESATMLRRANTALQHAKDLGPGTVKQWTTGLPPRSRARDDERSYALICWPDPGMRPTLVSGRSPRAVDELAAQVVTDTTDGQPGPHGRSTLAVVIGQDPKPAGGADTGWWLRRTLARASGSYLSVAADDVHDADRRPLPRPVQVARPPRQVGSGSPGRRRAA
ncbi:GGDEF domain-containing protein [Catellatospora chokoriensis]|nr:GGDEF domain-containing protein [Catellatospora chokoriensis]